MKEEKYQAILKELDSISKFVIRSNKVRKKVPQFSKRYGFDNTLEYAYEILTDTSAKNSIYHHLNKILSYFRDMKELDYAVYIKGEEGHTSRFFLAGEEAEEFTQAAWNTTFADSYKKTSELKNYAQKLIDKKTQCIMLSQHIESYWNVLDNVLMNKKLKMKNADKYEAFEFHYQKHDLNGNYRHRFNKSEIVEWIQQRGTHNTLAWYQTGDVGLTSVKSINLQEKVQLLTISKPRSLVEVFALLEQLFISQINEDNSKTKTFGIEEISTIVKAFTPTVNKIRAKIEVNVKEIVETTIKSLLS